MAKRKEMPDIVLVEWVDTTSNNVWHNPTDALRNRPWRCFTVGFNVPGQAKGADYVTVAPVVIEDNERFGDVWTIPKGCIKSIRRIKYGKKY